MTTRNLVPPQDRDDQRSENECRQRGEEQEGGGSSSSSFGSLPLAASRRGVAAYAASQNFVRLTPVQAAAIPLLLRQDAAVQAVTGSGKTLAFLIPIVERVLLHRRRHLQMKDPPSTSDARRRMQVHSIILSPTRELAQQTFAVAQELFLACGSSDGLEAASPKWPSLPPPLLLTGGGGGGSSGSAPPASLSSDGRRVRPVTLDLQTFRAEGNDVLVGTPGRVNDFLSYRTAVDCSELEYLILDEADIMFDNGALASTLSDILSRLPKHKRVGLFSATTSSASLQEWMVRVGMRNPVWVDVAVAAKPGASAATPNPPSGRMLDKHQQRTPMTLSNFFVSTHLDEKLSRLVAFLQDHKHEKVIVFFLTCACVDFFGRALQQLFIEGGGPTVELLHGKLVQKRREKTLERFHTRSGGEVRGCALACTDVAARGLHLTDVDWVVQFDPPQDPAMFIHRVGRTARAGKAGKSLLFLTPKEEAYVELLQARQVPIHPLPASERCCPATESPNEAYDRDDNAPIMGKVISSSCGSPLTDVLPMVRDMVLKDRDLLEKGTHAFTSYVRAYKEHRCAFIFRFQSLDLGRLASSCALLRLPKMPELRNRLIRPSENQAHKKENRNLRWHLPHFEPAGPEVDIYAIPYADAHREAARQLRLSKVSDGAEMKSASCPHKSRNERETRGIDRGSNRETRIELGNAAGQVGKRGRNARIVEEWDELAKEERLYKKLRKKKVTQEQFDTHFMGEE